LPHSERLAELAPLAAIGVLDGTDREEFAGHLLSGCGECARSIRNWQHELAFLAWAVPSLTPDVAQRTRLRLSAAAEPRTGRLVPFPAVWLAAAAALVLALLAADDFARRRELSHAARENAALVADNRRAREEGAAGMLRARFLEDPDVQAIFLSGLGSQPNARGKVIYSPLARRAILVSPALAPLPADRQYELWFLSGGKAIAAGTFDPSGAKPTVFESAPVPGGVGVVEKFAVSIEPRGGVAQPTGPIILAGGVPEKS